MYVTDKTRPLHNRLKRGHPLTQGLTAAYNCYDLYGLNNDLMSVNDLYVYPSVIHGESGLFVALTAGSSIITLPQFSTDSAPHTILMGLVTDISLINNQRFFQNNGTSTHLIRTDASGNAEFLLNSLTGTDRVSHSWTVNADEYFVIGGSWAGSGSPLKIATQTLTDGIKLTTAAGNGSGTYTVVSELVNPLSELDGGGLIWFYAWDYELTDADKVNVITNPWQLWESDTFIPLAAVGGATGKSNPMSGPLGGPLTGPMG